MALELTKQVEAVLEASKYFQQYEARLGTYGAFMAYMQGGEALLPKAQVEAIKNSSNYRDISFPVMQKRDISVITARSCSFTGAEGTSAKPQFSYINRGFAIRIYPKVHSNNMLAMQTHYANELRNGIRSLLENLDTYAVAQLEANKNTDLVTTTLPDVSIAASAYQIAPTGADKLYFKIPVLAELNDVGGSQLVNVCSTEAIERLIQYESNGQNNQQNLQAVLNGTLPSASNYRHLTTKRITSAAGVAETHFIIPFGGIGLFTFVDSQARAGATNLVDNKQRYTLTDGIVGIEWDVTAKPICSDLSATYGSAYTEVDGMEYRFAADFAFMNAYSSDNSSPIHKVEVLAAS